MFYDIFKSLCLNKRLPFVVVGTASPQASVLDDGFERFGFPKFKRLCRHHVVVSVDEHSAGCRVYNLLSVNHRIAICRHHFCPIDTCHQQQFFPTLGTSHHVGTVFVGLSTHTGYTNQTEQLFKYSVLIFLYILFYHNFGFKG